jgi:Kef-type K+ transport system membrane component KefB
MQNACSSRTNSRWGSDRKVFVLSELGAAFLLFSVGIETPLEQLKVVGKSAVTVAVLGVVFPFVTGFVWALSAGNTTIQSAFVACAFIATSAGITAKVLQELGVLDKKYSQIILAAAVIDDVLAMLILTVVSSVVTGGEANVLKISAALAEAVLFIVVFVLVGRRFASSRSQLMGKPLSPLSPWTISIALCIGFAVLASYIGLAAIIGAFLVGMVLAETEYKEYIHEKLTDLNAFIVPFFFIVTGLSLDIRVFTNVNAILSLLFITFIAIAAKFAGGYLGAGQGARTYRLIGMGMVPRGEVGVIIAGLGMQFLVISVKTYSLLVGMSLLTSIMAAPFIARLSKADQEFR